MPGTWTTLKNKPDFAASTMLLLNDGNVMCQDSGGTRWFKLTPDDSGDYVNGVWSELAPMAHTRLYYASAVLRDGRVIACGGEYSDAGSETNACEIYNPATDAWTKLDPPPGWANIGDAACVVLADGRFLLGNAFDNKTAIFDPATGNWSAGGDKLDLSSEESWVLLPDGSVVVAQAAAAPGAERYLPASNTWVAAGTVPVNLVETASREIGPGILLSDGRALFVGATNKTALYTPGADVATTGTWAKGPDFPDIGGKPIGAKDAPGCLVPNGRALIVGGPVDDPAAFGKPTYFFEFDGTNLVRVADPVNAADVPYVGRMMMTPSGQVLFAAATKEIAVYTPDGGPLDGWRPTITAAPTSLRAGGTYSLFGTQLNGLSQAVGYGDDSSAATNYPLVRLRFDAGPVVHCRTFDHSTMGVATGSAVVSTNFLVPAGLSGPAKLTVVANGIESAPRAVVVNSLVVDHHIQAGWQFLFGSLADGPLWAWGPNGPVPIGPWGPDLVAKATAARKQMLAAMTSLTQVGTLAHAQRQQAAASQAPAVDPELFHTHKPCPANEAIRIARIYPTGTMRATRSVAPATRPRLTYRGGDLMTSVQVATVFWGSAWQKPDGVALATKLNDFFRFIVGSSLIDQLAEYNTPAQRFGHGTFGGTSTIVTSEPAAVTTDVSIRNLLRDVALHDAHLPRPSKNTLYCVFTPAGVQVKDGADASCTVFCGYHNAMDAGIFYAALPFPGCAGCLNGHTEFDSLTITASHELVEAITDPVPGQGWYDDTFGEIGDIDNTQVKRVGAFLVQKEWSNRARRPI